MIKTYFHIIFYFIFIFSTPIAADIKHCTIKNEDQHQKNQKILTSILERELAANPGCKPFDQANYLSQKIGKIAKELIKEGFSSEAYGIPKTDEGSFLSFNCFPLWEGKNRNSIPLTFFVYIWPPKELALKQSGNDPRNCHYASPIHSHPIPCSFAVLDGSLIQNNFKLVEEKTVRWVNAQKLQKGESDIDDLNALFIHQMYHSSHSDKPSISLHAYGLDNAEKVMQCFSDTSFEHTYRLAK